jgi:hypothetical protein
MNLKKGTIYNTPLNPLSRGEFLGEFSQEGSFWGKFSQEGSFWGKFSQEGSYKENPLSRGEFLSSCPVSVWARVFFASLTRGMER